MNQILSSSAVWAQGHLGKGAGEPEIVFAQVREDAAVELELLRTRPPGETVFCIGSGGCTAFALLLAQPAQLQIVDVNPAQMYLIELKKAALERLPYSDRLRCLLTDARPYAALLLPFLTSAAQEFWKKRESLLAEGLMNCGLLEHRLHHVMKLLPLVQSRRNQRRLFSAKTLADQQRLYQTLWNHWRWKLAFELVLSKPVLRLAYGEAFIQALPPRFAGLVKERVDECFLRYPLWQNGYLWQTFRGVYPRHEAGLPLFLQRAHYATIQEYLPTAVLSCADAALWLEAQPPCSIGFFALSNILEVVTAADAQRLMRAVAHAAKPEALVCLRSISPYALTVNASLFALGLPDDVTKGSQASDQNRGVFEVVPSKQWEEKDRSFLCKNLLVLRVLST